MLKDEEFHEENTNQWLQIEETDEIIDSSVEFKEIQSGLTSKFYDFVKSILPQKDDFSFDDTKVEKNVYFGFHSQPKPWLSPTVLKKVEKLKQGLINREEMTSLLKEIAESAIDFYKFDSERFVALRFDGRVAEVADSDIDLLLKIQGRDYGMPIFVWHVGYQSFLGWNP